MNQKPSRSRLIETQITGNALLVLGIVILVPIYLFTPFAPIQSVCIFLLLLLLCSRFYSGYLVKNIRVNHYDAELRVFRHEWVKVKLWAENKGLLPAFMLVIGDTPGIISVFKNRRSLCSLPPRSQKIIVWQGYCTERGIFTLGPVVIRGADPLGLFPFQINIHDTSRLIVYPAFRSIKLKATGGIPLGNMNSANLLFEDITRCRSLRPYYPGDDKWRINWKVSAHTSHTNDFMINEYEATASHPLMIFLNLNQHEYPSKNTKFYIERTIEAAAALCLRASREHQALGIVFFSSFKEGGLSVITPSALTLIPILERLAAWRMAKSEDKPDTAQSGAKAMLDQGKHLPYGTRYLYTGPDLGDEAYIHLNSLKKHHLTLEYLIINDETVLPMVPGNSPRYQLQERGYEII